MRAFGYATAAVVFLAWNGCAMAQTSAADSANAPALTLTDGQKQTIYQSVSATQKNNAAPAGFRPAVGALLPDTIALAPMPDTVVQLIPSTKGLQVAVVEKQVLLVDPSTKSVVTVVTGAP